MIGRNFARWQSLLLAVVALGWGGAMQYQQQSGLFSAQGLLARDGRLGRAIARWKAQVAPPDAPRRGPNLGPAGGALAVDRSFLDQPRRAPWGRQPGGGCGPPPGPYFDVRFRPSGRGAPSGCGPGRDDPYRAYHYEPACRPPLPIELPGEPYSFGPVYFVPGMD